MIFKHYIFFISLYVFIRLYYNFLFQWITIWLVLVEKFTDFLQIKTLNFFFKPLETTKM